MKAMILEEQRQPLRLKEIPDPEPGEKQVLIKVEACGVCRTDLHILDGDLTEPKLPLVPGHEIVGTVVKLGPGSSRFPVGTRVGVPWLGYTCGSCKYCRQGLENLCEHPLFTGYTTNGGYAEYCVAHEDYVLEIPSSYSSREAAPLLCAGLIGYRSYVMAKPRRNIGLYGFGASAHIICQVASHQGKNVFAFTRDGDVEKQEFARSLGATWAGGSSESPPEPLDSAIIFAPAGELIPLALKALDKGGRLVCAGIYMSDIPSFPYEILWEERSIRSVANLTREDGRDFMKIASTFPIKLHTQPFDLSQANQALEMLRSGQIKGAAVLIPD